MTQLCQHSCYSLRLMSFCHWPLHPVRSCTVQEHPAASLQKRLCPLSQTWWAVQTWRRGWRKSWASSRSWPCRRSRRGTDTRTAGWRRPGEHIQLSDGEMWIQTAERSDVDTHHVLIEEVNDHVGQSGVAPVSVNQEEFFQVFEARYSEITRHDCLQMTKSFGQWE